MAEISLCTIEGCGKPVLNKGRGWCSMHYQRWRANGDPLVSKVDRQHDGVCSENRCDRKVRAKRLCTKHYMAQVNGRRYELAAGLRHAKHGQINELPLPDAAYIAGLIDADGTITVSAGKNSPRPKPMVLIVNGNLRLIEWLRAAIGAGCAYRTKTKPTRPDQDETKWNEVHRFQITGWKALSLLDQVRIFLRVKARQADLLMSLSMRGRDFRHKASAEQIKQSEVVMTEIRTLNRRGVKEVT